MTLRNSIEAGCAAAVAFCVSGLPAQAQQRESWVNQELRKANTPVAQYNAIGRGDFAACNADSTVTVERTLPSQVDCRDLNSLMGGMGGYACGQRTTDRRAERERLFKDLTIGCMAKKGWLLMPREQ